MPKKMSTVLKAAKWLGPLAIEGIRRLAKNPEAMSTVKEQGAKLLKNTGDKPEDVLATIEALRDQVDYLEESADDRAEADRAAAWAKQLEKYERAARLLQAPGATKADLASLKKKVGELRGQIFSAFVQEQEEDAGRDRRIES